MTPEVAVLLSPPVSAGVGEAPSGSNGVLALGEETVRQKWLQTACSLAYFFIYFLYNPPFLSSKIQSLT